MTKILEKIKKLSLQENDLVVINVPPIATKGDYDKVYHAVDIFQQNCFQETGITFHFMVIPHDYSVDVISTEKMAEIGWVRKEDV